MADIGKYIVTFWICMSFISIGCVFNIIGPTLFDLAAKSGVHVTIISLVFLTQGVGIFIGTVTSGSLFARFNHKLLLSIVSMVGAVSTAVCGWSNIFILVAMMFFLQGVAIGSLEGGGLLHCIDIWQDESSSVVHFISVGLSLGSIVCPLLVGPYLSELGRNMTNSPDIPMLPMTNLSAIYIILNLEIRDPSFNKRSNSTDDLVITREGHVEYPYFVVSGTLLVTGAAFLLALVTGTGSRSNHNLEAPIENDVSSYLEDDVMASLPDDGFTRSVVPSCPTRCIKILANMIALFVAGNQNVYGNLIPVYFVESGLGLQTGTYLTSAFWVIFTLSRLLCGFVVRYVGNKNILTCCMVLANVGSISLFFRNFSNAFLLVAIIHFALGTSAIFPGLIGWIKETVSITSMDVAILLSSACVGHMIWTVGISIAMDTYGSIVFDYVVMGTNFLMGFCWLISGIKQFCYRENLKKYQQEQEWQARNRPDINQNVNNERTPLLSSGD